MVWHSWAAGLPGNTTLRDFYPGDNAVDWIGVSLFQQFYPNHVGGTVKDLTNVLKFAARHKKPTMIAESTPFGGINHNSITNDAPMWEAWFEPTLHLIERHNISMWSYINCNWDVQPFWKTAGFGDTRISTNSYVMGQWLVKVVSDPRFILATDDMLCGNAPYSYEYSYNYAYDDDDLGLNDNYSYRGKRKDPYHYHYDYHYDDDDYFTDHDSIDDSPKQQRGFWWLWGLERNANNSDGLWNAVLPLVMLSSSLAIIIFLYITSRRGPRRRLERTPRAQRVRFAQLDDEEDDDDGGAALYGSTDNNSNAPHWKRSVRRIGPNLVVTNTTEGTTVVL
jgi:hypothetical protein